MNNLPKHTVDSVVDQLFCCDEIIYRHPPKVLLLYGSTRKRAYSRLVVEEAERILSSFGAETKIFDPRGLPLFDADVNLEENDEPQYNRVKELRAVVAWSEAHVWCSPEVHGNMTGVLKNMIDWIPLKTGAVRPTQGKLLAVCQVTGGSQSFNVVNNLRVLGRWMRMFTIPNQSSIAKAYQEFDDDGRLKDSPYKDRLIDVMEELFKFTLLLRGNTDYLTRRHSEEKT